MPKKSPDLKAFVNAIQAKGGAKYFDLGGPTTPAPLTQPTTVAQPNAPGSSYGGATVNPAGQAFQGVAQGVNSFEQPSNQAVNQVANSVGGTVQGVVQAFTPQNQYQAQLAPTTNLDYTGVANQSSNNALNGYGQLQGTLSQEQQLTNQLMAEGNGQGPNPALAQLNQTTGQNVAAQAALAAGQRGASSNAGLIARQAGQTGAATQQAAVGQGATLAAQQQLAAQQGAAAVLGQSGNQITNEQQANNQLFGTGANANNAQNTNLVNNYSQAQGINANVAQANTNAVGQNEAGFLGGASSLLALLAHGGEVKKFAAGGPSLNDVPMEGGSENSAPIANTSTPAASGGSGPVSWVGRFLNNSPLNTNSASSTPAYTPPAAAAPTSQGSGNAAEASKTGSNIAKGIGSLLAKGGSVKKPSDKGVPAMVSPQEVYLDPKDVSKVTKGANPMKVGERIPGKPKVKGDSLKNDVVPKVLDEGGIVIPNHITQSANAPEKAAAFVRAIQAKQGLKRK